MKNIIFKTSFIILSLIILSCSKENGNSSDVNGNKFTFQGKTHPTEGAFYQEGFGNVSISLWAENGEKNQIIFLFNNLNYANITGNYTYKNYEDPTFSSQINYGDNIIYLGSTVYEKFNQGTINISKSAGSIVIKYSFNGSSGSVQGIYSGSIIKN